MTDSWLCESRRNWGASLVPIAGQQHDQAPRWGRLRATLISAAAWRCTEACPVRQPRLVKRQPVSPSVPWPAAFLPCAGVEQEPTNSPHKRQAADPNMLVSGLCIRREARKAPVTWWRGFPVTSNLKTSAPPYVLVAGLA